MSLLQRARALSWRSRIAVLLAVAAAVLLATLLVPPVPQDPAYHDLADPRALWGIPNFGDIISNAPFLAVGVLGLAFLLKRSSGAGSGGGALRLPFLVYFAGVGLVALGSAYYHAAPTNETLFWDRLPMAIAFMALFSGLIADRVQERSWPVLLPALVVLGMASVVYWSATEAAGHGDLRPYAVVQFFPMLAIPLICIFFPPRRLDARYLVAMAGLYGLAKVLEYFDHGIFELLGQTVSGHSLKHLTAAAAAYLALPMLKHPGRGATVSEQQAAHF
jgi:hypothetical protein